MIGMLKPCYDGGIVSHNTPEYKLGVAQMTAWKNRGAVARQKEERRRAAYERKLVRERMKKRRNGNEH